MRHIDDIPLGQTVLSRVLVLVPTGPLNALFAEGYAFAIGKRHRHCIIRGGYDNGWQPVAHG